MLKTRKFFNKRSTVVVGENDSKLVVAIIQCRNSRRARKEVLETYRMISGKKSIQSLKKTAMGAGLRKIVIGILLEESNHYYHTTDKYKLSVREGNLYLKKDFYF